ncbi:protein ABHD13 [Parasteatoda tepidariorum]|uniref:protein ABHD13 n=1 Tax=Parasteatoda tepidariorum TaxID=114398 RepID=UPI00077FDFF5|nr:protein ABHD13 [Parasteatoda tepidariorum]
MAKIKSFMENAVHNKNVLAAKYEKLDPPSHVTKATSIDITTEQTNDKLTGFREIKFISNLVLFFLKKCWMMCSAAVFVIFVIYWYYGSITAFILFVFALTGFLFQVGDYFLYHPNQPPQARLYIPQPSLFQLPFESVFITTADGVKIHGFLIKQAPSIVSNVPTVLYLHGNAGNIGHRLPNAQGLHKFCGYNVLLLEYRGYGHSNGSPSEEGLYLDAQAGLKYLLQQPFIDKSKIIVFGRSLGGAVAIDLVSHPEYAKHVLVLIVENTFTSIPDIAREMFNLRILRWLPTCAFKNQFLSIKKIRRIKRPSLFISGQADVIIPPSMMRALLLESGSPIKRLYPFEYGTHNETWQCKGYYKMVSMFIDDVMLAQEMNICPSNYDGRGEIY